MHESGLVTALGVQYRPSPVYNESSKFAGAVLARRCLDRVSVDEVPTQAPRPPTANIVHHSLNITSLILSRARYASTWHLVERLLKLTSFPLYAAPAPVHRSGVSCSNVSSDLACQCQTVVGRHVWRASHSSWHTSPYLRNYPSSSPSSPFSSPSRFTLLYTGSPSII